MNSKDLTIPVDEAEKLILDIAKGEIKLPEITAILKRAIKKG